MSDAFFKPVFTDAGRAAVAAAHGLGLQAKITHVAIGDGAWLAREPVEGAPTSAALNATALVAEKARTTVKAGGALAPAQVRVDAIVAAGAPNFWIRELGFFLEDGTLLAVGAHDTLNLGWRGSLAPWVFRFTLAWTDLPANSVTVVADGDAAQSALSVQAGQLEGKIRRAIEGAGETYDPTDDEQLNVVIGTANRPVRRPVNVAPADEAEDVGDAPTLEGSAYYSLYGLAHGGSRFQVARDAAFTDLAYDSGWVAAALTRDVPTGALAVDSEYWWRIAYRDVEEAESDWSEPTQFTTAADFASIVRPTITSPVGGAANVPLPGTLVSSAFAVQFGADTHAASEWQVRESAGSWSAPLWGSGETAANLESITLPDGTLAPLGSYVARVRHKGAALSWSAWSPEIAFSMQAQPAAPVNVVPADGAGNVTLEPTLQSSSFSVPGGSDTHVKSQWQVATDAGFTAIVHDTGEVSNLTAYTVPSGALSVATTYRWRVRHKGSTLGWSSWSAATQFTTAPPSGEAVYTTPGSYTFTVPAGVTSVCALAVGGGAGGAAGQRGGGGGGTRWKNAIAVTPGEEIPVTVGAGGSSNQPGESSSFGSHVTAAGGQAGGVGGAGGGGAGGDGGGDGGSGGLAAGGHANAGGGGAGGYTGDGGDGGDGKVGGGVGETGEAGSGGGGGGGGGAADNPGGGGGGGIGLAGAGTNGAGGAPGSGGITGGFGGAPGSGGTSGANGGPSTAGAGGAYGGGGAALAAGAGGAVRIIWGAGRSYPNNAA